MHGFIADSKHRVTAIESDALPRLDEQVVLSEGHHPSRGVSGRRLGPETGWSKYYAFARSKIDELHERTKYQCRIRLRM